MAKRIDVVAAALRAGFDIDDLGALTCPTPRPTRRLRADAAGRPGAAGTAQPVLAEV